MDERDCIALCVIYLFIFFFFVIYFLSWDRYGRIEMLLLLSLDRV